MLMKALLLAFGVPTAAAGIALATADYVIVDVREGGPNGHHIVLPVPISLAQMALAFAPDEARRIEVPEVAEHLDTARAVLAEIRKAPDFDLVRVEKRDEQVLVRKVGDTLEVEVYGRDGEEVEVYLPLAAVEALLDSYDGRSFSTSAAIDAVRLADGDLVHVHDGNDEVRIRIW